jgi:hypothetical protein
LQRATTRTHAAGRGVVADRQRGSGSNVQNEWVLRSAVHGIRKNRRRSTVPVYCLLVDGSDRARCVVRIGTHTGLRAWRRARTI